MRSPPEGRLDDATRERLLALADRAVTHAAETGELLPLNVEREHPFLQRPGASFVTLKTAHGEPPDDLRGCIGSVVATRSLAVDVAANGAAAALRDPRFTPVRPHELPTLRISVSVLSAFVTIDAPSEEALLADLRPGIDGLMIREGSRRAVFLPQVWEQLPHPTDFLHALRRKAGLPFGWYSETFLAERFTVEKIG